MLRKLSPVVIDNTNLQASEAKPYVELARKHGYSVSIREPTTTWWQERNVATCHLRSTHQIPLEKMIKMYLRYEAYSVQDCLTAAPIVAAAPPQTVGVKRRADGGVSAQARACDCAQWQRTTFTAPAASTAMASAAVDDDDGASSVITRVRSFAAHDAAAPALQPIAATSFTASSDRLVYTPHVAAARASLAVDARALSHAAAVATARGVRRVVVFDDVAWRAALASPPPPPSPPRLLPVTVASPCAIAVDAPIEDERVYCTRATVAAAVGSPTFVARFDELRVGSKLAGDDPFIVRTHAHGTESARLVLFYAADSSSAPPLVAAVPSSAIATVRAAQTAPHRCSISVAAPQPAALPASSTRLPCILRLLTRNATAVGARFLLKIGDTIELFNTN